MWWNTRGHAHTHTHEWSGNNAQKLNGQNIESIQIIVDHYILFPMEKMNYCTNNNNKTVHH